MCGMGIFKRVAPFFLTLMAGIFIASIFVDVSSPFGFRARRIQMRNELEQLRIENDQLRRENRCMRRQFGVPASRTFDGDDFSIPPVPPPPVKFDPPPPPRASR